MHSIETKEEATLPQIESRAKYSSRSCPLTTVADGQQISYYGAMTDELFSQLVAEGVDAIPERFQQLMDNVVITIEPSARPEQTNEVAIAKGHTLLGLYQGVPRTRRGPNYGMVLPDKITIFKEPIVALGNTPNGIRQLVTDTVWHEIAHHFGLDDKEIDNAQKRRHATI